MKKRLISTTSIVFSLLQTFPYEEQLVFLSISCKLLKKDSSLIKEQGGPMENISIRLISKVAQSALQAPSDFLIVPDSFFQEFSKTFTST